MKAKNSVRTAILKVLLGDLRDLDREHRKMKAENHKQVEEILAWGKLRKWDKGAPQPRGSETA